eukprot:ANDGO_03866.mRNA.1 hypothetical protein
MKVLGIDISNDAIESAESIFASSISLYKILMGTLLAVWVPQSCPENNGETCSINQQFTDLTQFNVFVLVWNFLTLVMVVVTRFALLLRERFLISHFDEDRTKPDTAWKEVLESFPSIKMGLQEQNKRCFILNLISLVFVALNIVFSLALVIIYWDSYRTGTVFVMYGVLIIELVWSSYKVVSNNDMQTCSAMRFDAFFHNVVDSKITDKVKSDLGSASANAAQVQNAAVFDKDPESV